MLGQLVAGQFALEAALAELAGADPAIRDRLRNQIGTLAGLQQQVGTATGGALSSLRAEVANLTENATAAARDARTSAASNMSSASIATLAQAAREQVNNVMAGMKDFDPYLHFGSKEEEEEYRRREAERRAYIEAEQAKGTPQGDLNAANAAIAQMNDAKTHGADRSPAFADRYAALEQARDRLQSAISPEPAKETLRNGNENLDPKPTPAPSTQTKSSDLDAAMAAFREAGVQNATPTEEIAAAPTRSQIDPVSRSPASGRV